MGSSSYQPRLLSYDSPAGNQRRRRSVDVNSPLTLDLLGGRRRGHRRTQSGEYVRCVAAEWPPSDPPFTALLPPATKRTTPMRRWAPALWVAVSPRSAVSFPRYPLRRRERGRCASPRCRAASVASTVAAAASCRRTCWSNSAQSSARIIFLPDSLYPFSRQAQQVPASLVVSRIFSARAHQAGITGLAVMGDYLVTSSLDRLLRVWRVVCGQGTWFHCQSLNSAINSRWT